MGVVPVIDLSAFLDGDAAQRREIAELTDRTCREIGFLCVTGHRVPEAVSARLYALSKEFFRRSEAEKTSVAQPAPEVIRGYIGQGKAALATTLGQETPPDLKETFSIGLEPADPNDPYYSAPGSRDHFATNLWPEAPTGFRTAWLEYWAEMERFSAEMMRLFAVALDLEEEHFAPSIDRHISILSAMFYPDQAVPPVPGQLRAGEHTDFGTMTILKPDTAPGGLQVRTREGTWEPVRAPAGAFVLNIGDMMARWTNDRWVSTLHRVVNPPPDAALGSERLSIGFFHQPNYDALVECLPSCNGPEAPARYPPVRAGDHLHAQFSAQVVEA
ncbi:MAG: 2-oxoglutarate and iron-dependent oxygenase domain-containing protein [Pseudomonadota bacterium]